jgi:nucleoside-diphosphate-sugar epimerase
MNQMLRLAGRVRVLLGRGWSSRAAWFLLASTYEVYGDPLVNPQPESYWGNVNPIGPRGVR